MEFELDAGWSLQPAGGSTGSAFLGVYANQKYFLKRNASPFLAALSVEHIPHAYYGRVGLAPVMC